jgi:hypothetical protein
MAANVPAAQRAAGAGYMGQMSVSSGSNDPGQANNLVSFFNHGDTFKSQQGVERSLRRPYEVLTDTASLKAYAEPKIMVGFLRKPTFADASGRGWPCTTRRRGSTRCCSR